MFLTDGLFLIIIDLKEEKGEKSVELLYKVQGTIYYKDSAAEVLEFIKVLQRVEKVSAKLITKPEGQETCRFGIQFSFYKKAKVGFVSDFLLLLSFGKRPESGEVVFSNSYDGEQHHVICDGWFISDEHCS